MDVTKQLARDIPIALVFIVMATLVLLFLLTGSVLVPIKGPIMKRP